MNHRPAGFFHSPAGISLSLIGPIGLLSFAGLKRRSLLARGSFFALLFFVTLAGIAGCSSSQQSLSSMTPAPTPTASNLTITATSGSITQSVTIAVTAQ